MITITRRHLCATAGLVFGTWKSISVKAAVASDDNGVSRSAASIHQENLVNASPQRIYRALLSASQFDRMVPLSEAMQAADMQKRMAQHPSQIGQQEGDVFALFGGYITGRHIRLVPNALIIQAWRAESWDPEDYSIARFDLKASGSGTRIVFDHTGFPSAEADHLAAGWNGNYWKPLIRVLT